MTDACQIVTSNIGYPMEPSLHPSRFLTQLAMNTITTAERAQSSGTIS